mmetsp:Transcript_55578/g.121735  ORF Transcript_55578/g.121735 Transcript_55578/m.121735 type:complete len:286 (-) Transcript_55578:22-879(-)
MLSLRAVLTSCILVAGLHGVLLPGVPGGRSASLSSTQHYEAHESNIPITFSHNMTKEYAAGAGFVMGALHGITGPDHIAAVLPLCVNKVFFLASMVGLSWGLGHGIGVGVLGCIAYAFKDYFLRHIHDIEPYMNLLIAVALILIGVFGLWSVYRFSEEEYEKQTTVRRENGLSLWAATLGTGILHGVSGASHLLGILPALSLPTWQLGLLYLAFFCLGCMVSMALFCGIAGQCTVSLKHCSDTKSLPRTIALAASVVAIVVGVVWLTWTLWEWDTPPDERTMPSQ